MLDEIINYVLWYLDSMYKIFAFYLRYFTSELTIIILYYTKIVQVTDYWLIKDILESLHLTAWYSPVRKSHQWKIIEGLGWTCMMGNVLCFYRCSMWEGFSAAEFFCLRSITNTVRQINRRWIFGICD